MKPSETLFPPTLFGWRKALEDGLKEMSPATFAASLNEMSEWPEVTDLEVTNKMQDCLSHLWVLLVRAERDRRQKQPPGRYAN